MVFSDEIDHGFCAATAGQRQHGFDFVAVGFHEVMRAALLGEIERLLGAVDHNDFRRTERREHLDADMAKSARADHRDIFAGQQMAGCFLGGAIGRQPRVGVCSDIFGRQRLG